MIKGSILEDLDIEEVVGYDYIDESVEEEEDAEDDLLYAEDEALLAVLVTDPAFTDLAFCDVDECE